MAVDIGDGVSTGPCGVARDRAGLEQREHGPAGAGRQRGDAHAGCERVGIQHVAEDDVVARAAIDGVAAGRGNAARRAGHAGKCGGFGGGDPAAVARQCGGGTARALDLAEDAEIGRIAVEAESLNGEGLVERTGGVGFDRGDGAGAIVDRGLRVDVDDIAIGVERLVGFAVGDEDQLVDVGVRQRAGRRRLRHRLQVDRSAAVVLRKLHIIDGLAGGSERNIVARTAEEEVCGDGVRSGRRRIVSVVNDIGEFDVVAEEPVGVLQRIGRGRNRHAVETAGVVVAGARSVEIIEGAEIETQQLIGTVDVEAVAGIAVDALEVPSRPTKVFAEFHSETNATWVEPPSPIMSTLPPPPPLPPLPMFKLNLRCRGGRC